MVLSKTVPVKLPECAMGWDQYFNTTAWLEYSKLGRRKKQKSKVWYKNFFKKVRNTCCTASSVTFSPRWRSSGNVFMPFVFILDVSGGT